MEESEKVGTNRRTHSIPNQCSFHTNHIFYERLRSCAIRVYSVLCVLFQFSAGRFHVSPSAACVYVIVKSRQLLACRGLPSLLLPVPVCSVCHNLAVVGN